MDRLCQIGDVIKSNEFLVWRKQKGGSYHLSTGPESVGNEWLVIETKMTGGGTGHGAGDIYPDGHEVTIQMVHNNVPDASYTLKFYQNGCFRNMIEPKKITLVRTLKQEVTTVWR